ncbi:MAG: RtcB family protein, partial [Desulfomonilaceae bacterium]
RQILMNLARTSMENTLRISPRELRMQLLYDVSHNIAKMERHYIDGISRMLCVHRKGATRALSPGHPLLPGLFKNTGQPVLIPGDMGRASYVMSGMKRELDQTFASACHGAGRVLSRNEALRKTKGRAIERELQDRDIYSRAAGRRTMREEFPEAYKNIEEVVDIVHDAGLAKKVVRIKPIGVVKG